MAHVKRAHSRMYYPPLRLSAQVLVQRVCSITPSWFLAKDSFSTCSLCAEVTRQISDPTPTSGRPDDSTGEGVKNDQDAKKGRHGAIVSDQDTQMEGAFAREEEEEVDEDEVRLEQVRAIHAFMETFQFVPAFGQEVPRRVRVGDDGGEDDGRYTAAPHSDPCLPRLADAAQPSLSLPTMDDLFTCADEESLIKPRRARPVTRAASESSE